MSVSVSNVAFEDRYTLPVIQTIEDSPEEIRRKQERIRGLARERNAVILAHSYQRDEIQEVAHLVGDSLKLSQEAAQTRSDVIVFCGVNFMAETAAILCPERTVLLPDFNAGCSLSASITAEELREWKARFPDAVVVSYVNTSATVKAESDYCCTSANAVKVVGAIPADRRVLFVPDRFLGAYVARQTKRMNMIIYPGLLPRSPDDPPGASGRPYGGASRCRAADPSGMRLRHVLHGPRGRWTASRKSYLLLIHGRDAAPPSTVQHDGVRRGYGNRNSASSQKAPPGTQVLPYQSPGRMRFHENNYAGQSHPVARNAQAAGSGA